MSKKRLILSQTQLDEICGLNSSYLDGDDMSGHEFSKEISSDGSLDNGYADQMTTDKYADDTTNSWRGNAKLHGMGPITVREGVAMKVSEWKKLYLEEKEHGNKRLKNKQFGATNGNNGKSYGATKTALCRKRALEDKVNNGTDTEKALASKRLQSMRKNWRGIDNAQSQYTAAENSDKFVRNNQPTGSKTAKEPNGLPKIEGGVFTS